MKSVASSREVRSIVNREELERVFDLLDGVFPNGREFFQQRLDCDRTYSYATTWIAKCDGVVASTVQIFPFACRIEDVELKVGGIGSVATHPDYRGKGLSQQILNEQTAWMAEQQYDLSLLFAIITPFYEKLGWNVVPEPLYELKSSGVPSLLSASGYEFIPFNSEYVEAMASIYNQFNHNRTYTVARPDTFWQDQLRWPRWQTSSCLIALRNKKPVAYGLIGTTSDGKVYLDELVYLKGEEGSAVPLFQALLKLRPDADTVYAKLPSDHVLYPAFTDWGAERQTIQYAMWKVIQLFPLMSKLTPVLTRRLQDSAALKNGAYCTHLICQGQHVYIHAIEGEVRVEQQPRANVDYAALELTQEQFITALLQGIDERFPLHMQQSGLLQALFPKQPFVFYLTDKF